MRKEDQPRGSKVLDVRNGSIEKGVALKRALRVIAVVTVLGLVAAACGGDDEAAAAAGRDPGRRTSRRHAPDGQLADVTAAFDPQKEYYSVTWEYYRCCLLRNLMSYQGVPTDEEAAPTSSRTSPPAGRSSRPTD